jgi:RHS repeat-associated protein
VSPASNQITTTGYAYDAAGNMTSDGINTLTYDGENHVSTSSGIGGTASYVYDAGGLRVRKCLPNCTSPTSSTAYIFFGRSSIAEYDNNAASTTPSREYVNSPNGLLATIDPSGTKYHMSDHLSVRMTTDASGIKIGEQGHFPFGESWYSSNTTTKFVLTGYERDAESGNDYARARVYISRIGRFNSPDPISGSPALPQTLNRYAYAANDPINLIDPTGMLTCWQLWEVDSIWVSGDPNGDPPTEGHWQVTSATLLDEGCMADPGDRGAFDGGPGGGGGPGGEPQVDMRALIDCIFAQFGVTLASFEPSQKYTGPPIEGIDSTALNRGGSFTGFGPSIYENNGMGYGEISVSNNNSIYSTPGLTKVTGAGVPIEGWTPEYAPVLNYTANDLSAVGMLDTQIFELGNSLALITGQIAPWDVVAGKMGDGENEPGQITLDCYKKGGPY